MEIDTHRVDAHVGRRLAEARQSRDMSQSVLAKAAKISFQQIQKYETGTNRVSASKLYVFACFLGVHIDYFFQGLPCPVESSSPATGRRKTPARLRLEELAKSPIGTKTSFAYGTFTSPRAVVALVNKIGQRGWAEITTTVKGTVVKKVGNP